VSALAAAAPRTDAGSAESYAAELYERHRRAIYGLCYKQLRRREDADDAVQTTFIYALVSLRRGVVPELELPWLLTIARNVCSTRRRTSMRRGAHESAQDLDSVQDWIASPERSDVATTEDFTEVLRAIPETQRQALLLREWRGLSYDEIGAELGLSQSATEALLFRARQNAAQRLGERTGLSAALQGLPLFSFLRKLFQSAAAKTLAVGAGAALTMVTVPAAQEARHAPAPKRVPTVEQSTPVVRAHRTERPRALPRHHDVTGRTVGRAMVRPVHATRGTQPVAVVPTGNDPSEPTQLQQSQSQPQPAQMPVTPPVATVVDDVVATANDVGQSLGLAEVKLPDVQTPAVTVPVTPTQTLTVPSVHLP
jgi:RNA polymerase sigma-70 factor, ECF subfamily